MEYHEPGSPPPFPRSQPASSPGGCRAAATLSIASAAICFGLVTMFERAMKTLRDSMGPEAVSQFAVVLMVVAILLLAVGLISGVLALTGIRKHGREGLLAKGLTGLLLSLFLSAIMVPNFIKGRNRAKEADNFTKALTDLTHSTDEEFTDPAESDKRVAATREAMDKVAANSSGLDGAMARAMSGCMRQLQMVLSPYTEAYETMQRAEVLDYSQLVDKADIEPKKEIVRKFRGGKSAVETECENWCGGF